MDLPPVPYRSPIQGNLGQLTPPWADWFKKLFERVGGNLSSSTTELASSIEARFPTGAIIDFGGTSAPTGFLLCDGSAVSRTDYADLFAVIGETWGVGDGSTTFNLPPPGRVYVGHNPAGGTFGTVGATGGAEAADLPDHVHSVSLTSGAPSATTNIADAGSGVDMPSGNHTHSVSGNTGNPTTTPTISVLMPYAVAPRIIKT